MLRYGSRVVECDPGRQWRGRGDVIEGNSWAKDCHIAMTQRDSTEVPPTPGDHGDFAGCAGAGSPETPRSGRAQKWTERHTSHTPSSSASMYAPALR
ncbi:hypothetical protein GCM10026982_29130 [Nocardiopsis aegyptia]